MTVLCSTLPPADERKMCVWHNVVLLLAGVGPSRKEGQTWDSAFGNQMRGFESAAQFSGFLPLTLFAHCKRAFATKSEITARVNNGIARELERRRRLSGLFPFHLCISPRNPCVQIFKFAPILCTCAAMKKVACLEIETDTCPRTHPPKAANMLQRA